MSSVGKTQQTTSQAITQQTSIQKVNTMIPVMSILPWAIGVVSICVIWIAFNAIMRLFKGMEDITQKFTITYDSLSSEAKNVIASFIQFQNQVNFLFEDVVADCTIEHIVIGTQKLGILITSTAQSKKQIVLTYYEFLNWRHYEGTLFIPKRELRGNKVYESDKESCRLAYDASSIAIKVNFLNHGSTPRVEYIGSGGTVLTVDTNTIPSAIQAVPQGDGVREFSPKTSLDYGARMMLELLENTPSMINFNYGQAGLSMTEIRINDIQVGYKISNSDQSVNFYLTYREIINLYTQPTLTFTLPTRTYTAAGIVSDMSCGYDFTSNIHVNEPDTRYITIVSASNVTYQSLLSANIADTLNQGVSYPFYITNNLLPSKDETLVNNFEARQSKMVYTFNGSPATASIISYGSVLKSGLKITINATTNLYLSYREILSWLKNDFRSSGANASLTIPAREEVEIPGPTKTTIIRPITNTNAGSYKLAFDPANNAIVNISFSSTPVTQSTTEYTNTSTTPSVIVTVNANVDID